MCRMCSYYQRIDLRQLPASNPFTDNDLDSPSIEPELPNNIIVSSPESQRYVAWQKMQRFPSLKPDSVIADPETSQRPGSFTIYGPREQSRLSTHALQSSPGRTYFAPTPRVTKHVPVAIGRTLQRQDRVLVPTQAAIEHPDNDQSHGPDSPKSISSMSDTEEFSYLHTAPAPLHKPQLPPILTTMTSHVPMTLQAGVRQPQTVSTQWMTQACQNL